LPTDRNLALTPANTLPGDIKVMVIVALVLALIAMILITLAADDILPRTRPGDSPTKLRDRTLRRAGTALTLLRAGQVVGVAAGVVVLVGSVIILVTPEKDKVSTPPTVVALTDAGLVCGELEGAADALEVGGHPVVEEAQLVIVEACPGS
jgi:hypothetical protein